MTLPRPRRLLAVAAAASVWAVLAPAPSALAGYGDPLRADRIAASLQERGAAAAQFGAQTGDPRFLAFADAAAAVAVQSGEVRAKLAAGDFVAAKICTARLERTVKAVDKLEDRLPRRAACGRSLRGARRAADRLADGIEDTFDDLEDEVRDLCDARPVRHVRFRAPAPAVPFCPPERPVVVTPPVVVSPPAVCPGRGACTIRGCDHGAPAWGGDVYSRPAAPTHGGSYGGQFGSRYGDQFGGGFGDQFGGGFGSAYDRPVESDYRDRDAFHGPGRGLNDRDVRFGPPADSLDGFGAPDAFDGYDTVPRARDGFGDYGAPALPAPGPQARLRGRSADREPGDRFARDDGRLGRPPGLFTVSFGR